MIYRYRWQASSHRFCSVLKIAYNPVGAGLPAKNDNAVALTDYVRGSTRSSARFTASSASMMIC
jgi:hypothetical protein